MMELTTLYSNGASHGRKLRVAMHKTFTFQDTAFSQATEHLFKIWRVYRHEFGGFSFKDYTVVIGGPGKFTNSYGNGFIGDDPFALDTFYSHEIYHAWAAVPSLVKMAECGLRRELPSIMEFGNRKPTRMSG